MAHIFTAVIFPIARRTRSEYDDLFLKNLQKPAEFLVVIAGLFLIVQILHLPKDPVDLNRFAHAVLKVLITFDVAWALFNTVDLLDIYLGKWVSRVITSYSIHYTKLYEPP